MLIDPQRAECQVDAKGQLRHWAHKAHALAHSRLAEKEEASESAGLLFGSKLRWVRNPRPLFGVPLMRAEKGTLKRHKHPYFQEAKRILRLIFSVVVICFSRKTPSLLDSLALASHRGLAQRTCSQDFLRELAQKTCVE